jgi:hypothetical protein
VPELPGERGIALQLGGGQLLLGRWRCLGRAVVLWEEMDDEQRHAHLRSAGVHALVVRKEDFTVSMVSEQGTQAADDLVLGIPMNVVTQVGDNWVVNIGLGTLREQLQHVAAV